jgi:hypothetical protein
MDFLWIFKLKCTLWSKAKLKIIHPSTTFTKVGRGFVQGIEQERHAKLANFSAPVNSEPAKLCALRFYTFFPLGDFEVFREILENVHKVYTDTRGVKRH